MKAFAIALLLILSCLGACTGPSEERQASLLATQQAAADIRSDRRQLFYIGLALFPEQWSENDVVDFGQVSRRTLGYMLSS